MNEAPRDDEDPTVPGARSEGKEFHPWKLLGWLLGVIAVLAVIAAIVDIIVLGW